jgi:hypothetical protein
LKGFTEQGFLPKDMRPVDFKMTLIDVVGVCLEIDEIDHPKLPEILVLILKTIEVLIYGRKNDDGSPQISDEALEERQNEFALPKDREFGLVEYLCDCLTKFKDEKLKIQVIELCKCLMDGGNQAVQSRFFPYICSS